jgi:6,7-dimethyl-8-ribityllumazine synthase
MGPASDSPGALPAGRHAIVVSTYNHTITDKLLSGAVSTLHKAGVTDDQIVIAKVPGAWELALGAKWLADDPRVISVITLGAVIRGETTHDQHINRAVSLALMELMQQTGKPIAFGLLTCNNLAQAIHRAGGDVGNKGEEAAEAALAMLRLQAGLA